MTDPNERKIVDQLSKLNNLNLYDNKETYSHTEHCSNCGHVNIIAIPKGTRISDYLGSASCSRCSVKLREDTRRITCHDNYWMKYGSDKYSNDSLMVSRKVRL